MAESEDAEVERSRSELENEAEALAQQVLHTSAREALRRVSAGELEGTLFASKLMRLFGLMGSGSNDTEPRDLMHYAAE